MPANFIIVRRAAGRVLLPLDLIERVDEGMDGLATIYTRAGDTIGWVQTTHTFDEVLNLIKNLNHLAIA